MAMQQILLAIPLLVIMAQMAIFPILAMAIGINSMAILGIQLKNIKQLAQWCWNHINFTFRSDNFNLFCDFVTFTQFFNVEMLLL